MVSVELGPEVREKACLEQLGHISLNIIQLTYGTRVNTHTKGSGTMKSRLGDGALFVSTCQSSAFKQPEKQQDSSISVNKLNFLELIGSDIYYLKLQTWKRPTHTRRACLSLTLALDKFLAF